MIRGLPETRSPVYQDIGNSREYAARGISRDCNPVRALTRDLVETYSEINSKYYAQQAHKKQKVEQLRSYDGGVQSHAFSSQPSFSLDSAILGQTFPSTLNVPKPNKESDYQIHRGEILGGHYYVEHKIGRGSFGQVVSAKDTFTNQPVAIKIIKNGKPFFVQAKTEIALLEEVNGHDSYDKYGLVRLLDQFVHNDHQCLVFEKLSCNLYDLLRKTNLKGISLHLIRNIGRQILISLNFLKSLNIIHCDLKPENILLRESNHADIKIIDFGSSCKANKQIYKYIQSRFYRAPEILLGQAYGPEIDMWSLGCMLMELHTGEPLFSGANEYEQMLRIVCLKGLPDPYLLDFSSKVNLFFIRQRDSGRWKFNLNTESQQQVQKFPRSLEQVLGLDGDTSKVFQRRINTAGHSFDDYKQFLDIVQKMLEYDPIKRVSPTDALSHAFFDVNYRPKVQSKSLIPQESTVLRRTGSAPNLNFLLG